MAALRNTSRAVDSRSTVALENVRTFILQAIRIVTILAGAYFIVAGLDIVNARLLLNFGLPHGEAMTWSVMLGFVFYVGIIMWAFAAPLHHRPATIIAALAILFSGAAIVLTPATAA